jgi:hypothetical protein
MSRIALSEGSTVSRVKQEVYVNGKLRTDVFCITVEQAITKGAATAAFTVPRLSFRSDVDVFDDAELVVYAWHSVDSKPRRPIFRGYTQKHTTRTNGRENGIVFSAISAFGMMRKVYVGHNTNNGERIYYRRDGWTFLAIMEDLFNEANLSAAWREKITLGNLKGLSKTDFITSDVSFPAENYFDAVYRLLALAGNVRVVETYTSTKTELNLFEFGDTTQPLRTVNIPARGLGPSQGAIVTDITRNVDHANIISGVRAYGHPQRYMVTVRTTDFEEADVPAGRDLEPAWPNASAYVDTALGSGTLAETAVLDKPSLATPANKTAYDQATDAQRFCFRVYRLPEAIRRLTVLDKNIAKTFQITEEEADFVNVPVQVWVDDFRLVDTEVTPNVDKIWDASNYDKRLIKGCKITNDGFLVLPEPAVSVRRISSFDGEVVKLYNRARLSITLSFLDRQKRPYYDTGVRGDIEFDGINEAGIYDEYINEKIFYDQIGTFDDEIPGPNGTTLEYGCIYFDEFTATWTEVAANSPVVIQNQLPYLKIYAERYIAERSAARVEYRLRLPILTTSIKPMDRIATDGKFLQVASVQHIVSDPNNGVATVIIATDAMPNMKTQSVPQAQASKKQAASKTASKVGAVGAIAGAMGGAGAAGAAGLMAGAITGATNGTR